MVYSDNAERFLIPPPTVTVEGKSKVGKGTGAIGTQQVFERDHGLDVAVIDQGQKFRLFGLETEALNIDIDSPEALAEYLNSLETQDRILERLGGDPAQLKELLDTDYLGTRARMIAPHADAQSVAIGLMERQILEAQHKDVIILDGRAMEAKALEIQRRQLGIYAVGFFITCDSAVAAMRQARIVKPINEMNEEERIVFLQKLHDIHTRNEADSTREIHPVVPPKRLVSVDISRFDIKDVPESPMYGIDTTYSKPEQLIAAMSALTLRAINAQKEAEYPDISDVEGELLSANA